MAESNSFQSSSVSTTSMNTQVFSSVKTAQSFFEQLDKKEEMSSVAVRSKAGLHKPDSIPTYQKNFDQLLSQRGITPEVCNAPAILQRPVTPTTDPPARPRDRSQEPRAAAPQPPPPAPKPAKQPFEQPPVYFHKDSTPISMTFQPVNDESLLRISPSRSRPNTPSMINKPAPIIPHYQMNLIGVEHLAPDTNMCYTPSSPEGARPRPSPGPSRRRKDHHQIP